jgi:myo-inositol 2-dehydrogenase/D-chiro-inositol 1-dehydrogenase
MDTQTPLPVAVVGLGRIGRHHAKHVWELQQETGRCQLVALVDAAPRRASETAEFLELSGQVALFESVEDLAASGVAAASVVCSSTNLHREHAQQLIAAGQRLLLEKPLTGTLRDDREFTSQLNERHPHALMLAFQRRFDEALRRAKDVLESGSIGEPFKVYSALEDSASPPDGYQSPGLLPDMSVHNIDEILWLTGQRPTHVRGFGARLHNQKRSSVREDFDDVLLQAWFESGLVAQIQVSRNHVPGYRVETVIYGDRGIIRVGNFRRRPHEVVIEVYGVERTLQETLIPLRRYAYPVPEFIERFGDAYLAEARQFLECCLSDSPFPVNQNDGLRAMEVAEAGQRSLLQQADAVAVEFTD